MASWRSQEIFRVLSQFNSFSKEELLNMDVYQFGVFNGDSMVELAKIFNHLNIETNCFYGFDVFTGMPKETAEPIFQDAWDPDLFPDAFNVLLKLNIDSPEKVASTISDKVKSTFSHAGNNTDVVIVPGLVEKTMIKKNRYKKAFYIDFDFDIYSPTKYAFEFLAKNNLVTKGTIIGYDDWGGTPHKNFEHGESRAHKEVTDKYGIVVEKIYEGGQGDPHIQTVWIVTEVANENQN